MSQRPSLLITGSPQFHDEASTANIMWTVSACLAPAGIWGVYVFGPAALSVLGASLAAALLCELLLAAIFRKFTLWDGSAFLTGLLVGMNMPPAIPLHIPVIASVFAIAVVKWTFGGLGGNIFNPALAGRVFAFFSWTGEMSSWAYPRTFQGTEATSGATPLGFLKSGLLEYQGGANGPLDFMAAGGYPRSALDGTLTAWLNAQVFAPIGISLPAGYVDLFMGSIPGCIGEVSALLLLAGTVHLFAKRIVTWEIPLAYLASFGVLVWVFGGLRFGSGLFSGDVLFHLFSGGLMLGAFYMATDMVSSPLTPPGMLVFGLGCGLLSYLIRFHGSFPEGVSLAILVMNIFVPLINRHTGPRRFGLPGSGGNA